MVVLVVSVLTAAGLAVATPASALSWSGRDDGGYLALGDSVAFGYEPPETTPIAEYFKPANFKGYPEYFGGVAGLRVTNASCPGETSASMIDVELPSFACSTPDGYRTNFPLKVPFAKGESQLDYAQKYLQKHSDTRLVTLTIGANDVFLCQATTDDECASDFPATLQRVGRNVATILATVRKEYSGPIVVVTYYAEDYTDPVETAGVMALNSVLVATAKPFGAEIADGYQAYKLLSLGSRGDSCAAGLLIPLPKGACNIHPSVRGDWALTASVAVARLRASRFQDAADTLQSTVAEEPADAVQPAVERESSELKAAVD